MTRFSESSRAARVFVVAVAVILVAGGGYALWLVAGPGPTAFASGKRLALSQSSDVHANPSGVPAELADAELVTRGEYLARAADCSACHTTGNGRAYTGGLGFVLPFGVIYSTNITPDKETGIGNYTDADFLRVMHQGVATGGKRLYPAMPYPSYTQMTDADALAIKAYLFSLPPVKVVQPANTLAFPFNQRWLMALWSAAFSRDQRFMVNAERSPQWNRGAYLAEAMAHCGECHTPRTVAFSLDNRRKFAGAEQAGWRAYNITPDKKTGVGEWSADQIALYISHGHAEGRGTAAGPMGEAVEQSFRYLTRGDVEALVAYVTSVPPLSSRDLPDVKHVAAPTLHSEGVAAAFDSRGKEIFEGACAGCHGWSGVSPVLKDATLTGVRAVNDPSAVNVVQVVLSGATRSGVYMPAFGAAYSDVEVAAVANYVVARFGARTSDVTASDVGKLRLQTAN
jgi:mono/diheme cytochrome c family protein